MTEDEGTPANSSVPAISNWRAARSTEKLQRQFSDPDFDDSGWSPIEVPSHWQTQSGFEEFDGTVLHRADLRVPRLQSDQRRWLRFDGICYTGDIFLDSVYVGQTEGYFTPHLFDVTDLLAKSSSSILAVEVGAPRLPEPGEPKRAITGWFAEPPGARRSWNPAGIWRPVSIVDTGPATIRYSRAICVEADEYRAVIALRAVILATAADDLSITTSVAGVTEHSSFTVAAGENRIEWTVEVPEPELWWPHGFGDQPMFDLRVSVRTSAGVVSDRTQRRIGFRTTGMRDFVLRVNRKRVFARGINVGPTELNLAQLPPEGFLTEMNAIRDAGFNFVRCRSHISRPEFYDACDDLGLLVWQDFPLVGSYARGVGKQAEQQARDMVDLLAHHPSIVVWGGHYRPHSTEPRSTATPDLRRQQIPSWNRTVLDRSIRRTIAGDDPSRKVVAHSDVAPHIPHLSGSDLGMYFGWFSGEASELAEYAAALPRFVRFVSDMGAQALPARLEYNLDELIDVFGAEPDALQAVIPATAFSDAATWVAQMRSHQANVLKTTIETLRVLKYQPVGGFCAGLWKGAGPGLSRALVDHDRTPRPALDAVRVALQPILAVLYPPAPTIPSRTSTELSLFICNDLSNAQTLTSHTTIVDQRGRVTRHWRGVVPADGVAFVTDFAIRGGRIGDVATVTIEVSGGPEVSVNSYSFRAA